MGSVSGLRSDLRAVPATRASEQGGDNMSDECGVSFDCDYDNDNAFCSETWRRARKPHHCGECRQTIQPKQRYLRVVGKADGEIWTAVLCEPCNEILHEFSSGAWSFGGEVWENFATVWSDGEPLQPCLNRLSTVAAKAKLRDMWLAHKDLDEIAAYRPDHQQEQAP
jgi:hypothetical protein